MISHAPPLYELNARRLPLRAAPSTDSMRFADTLPFVREPLRKHRDAIFLDQKARVFEIGTRAELRRRYAQAALERRRFRPAIARPSRYGPASHRGDARSRRDSAALRRDGATECDRENPPARGARAARSCRARESTYAGDFASDSARTATNLRRKDRFRMPQQRVERSRPRAAMLRDARVEFRASSAAVPDRRRSSTRPTRAAVRPRACRPNRAARIADRDRVRCAPASAGSAPSSLR